MSNDRNVNIMELYRSTLLNGDCKELIFDYPNSFEIILELVKLDLLTNQDVLKHNNVYEGIFLSLQRLHLIDGEEYSEDIMLVINDSKYSMEFIFIQLIGLKFELEGRVVS